MDIVRVDAGCDAETLASWHRLMVGYDLEMQPGVDPCGAVEARADLVSDATGERAGVMAVDGDVGIGALRWEAPAYEDQDLAWAMLYVARGHRRRGVARALLAAARSELLPKGRVRLLGDTVEGGVGVAFGNSVGARVTDTDVRNILDLAYVDERDLRALAVAKDDYRLVQFVDRCPDELAGRYTRVRTAMNDAPTGEMNLQDAVWDEARLRALENHRLDAGIRSYATAAVHDETGEVGGFTEVLVVDRPTTALQEDTGVARTHRGHGLGLAIKSANLLRVLREQPQLTHIVTWNAESNRHMRAINERLGYRVADRHFDLELRFDAF